MREYNKEEFKTAEIRMDKIEVSIKQEVRDRVVETDELIYVVRNDLTGKLYIKNQLSIEM